jgi:HK97 family phage major capsid protein
MPLTEKDKTLVLNQRLEKLLDYSKICVENQTQFARSKAFHESMPQVNKLWDQRMAEHEDFAKWFNTPARDYQRSDMQKKQQEIAKAIYGYYTTETSTAYLVPEIWSSQIWGRILEKSVMRGLCDIINFSGPGDILHIPTTSAGLTSKTRGEPSTALIDLMDDTSRQTISEKQLTKVRHFVATWVTPEVIQDAGYDIMSMISMEMADAIRIGEEDALINGDSGGVSAPDVQSMFDGFIYDAGQTLDVQLQPLSNNDFTESMALLGDNRFEPGAFVCTRRVANRFLDKTEFDHVLTIDKYGPRATVLNGELARLYGVPIVVSDLLPKTAGTPDYSTCLMIDRRAGVIGNVSALELQREFWARYQVNFLILIQRLGYVTRYANGIVKLTNVFEKA